MKSWLVLVYLNGEVKSYTVTADYHRVQDGTLTFRNNGRGNEYPEPVHVFAHGYWLEVQRV